MSKKMLALLLAASLSLSLTTPAFALIKGPNPGSAADAGTSKSSSVDMSSPVSASASGAFTGTTSLSQFLYQKFSSSPATLSVPVTLFKAKGMQQRFNELGEAAVEAYIQNGLTDYVTAFDYSYTEGNPSIIMKLTYYNSDSADRQAKTKALNDKIDAIIAANITSDMSLQQKAEALYQYVSRTVKYDFDGFNRYQAGQNVYDLQTAYTGLVLNKGICQGFSRSYKALCDRAGIPCVVVFGRTTQFNTAHSWCRVNVDGTWRTVDPSNPQLSICRQNGIFIDDATYRKALVPEGAKTLVASNSAAYI